MRLFLAVAFISIGVVGCATSLKLPAESTDRLLKSPTRGITELRFKFQNVDSAEAGRRIVTGRQIYLLDFFRQSQEPYFGAARWSPQCIEGSQIGNIVDSNDGISFRSMLTADEELKTGLCTPVSFAAVQLVGLCEKENLVYDIVMRGPNSKDATFVCPDALKIPK